MDAFIRNNRSLVLSTFYLLAALAFAGYSLVYLPAMAAIADLTAARKHVASETRGLKSETVALGKLTKKAENKLKSIPAFLSQVNRLSNQHNVIIRKLMPDDFDKLTFKIEMISNYYEFVKFAAQLESIDVTIQDMEIRPYDNTKATPRHFITFSITPAGNVETVDTDKIKINVKLANTPNKRNPFQRLAPMPAGDKKSKACINQTWVYKLSGIGSINNKKFATINSIDYKKGDTLADMTIDSILAEHVVLTKVTRDSSECHILKFRQKAKEKKKRRRRRS